MNKKGLIFIFIGVLCIITALAFFIHNSAETQNAYESSARITYKLRTQLAEKEQSSDNVLPTDNPDREMPAVRIDGKRYAGILETMTNEADEKDREILTAVQEKLESVRVFSESLTTYTDAVAEAKEGADSLKKGADTLKDSAWKLSLGSGVLKAAIPDLSGVPEALKETAALGEAYNNYAGLAEGMSGKVRFIWKVEGIGE